jgi:ABC-type xylose transport system permease subunit
VIEKRINAPQADFSASPTRQIVELLLEHAVCLILIVLLAVFCIFIPGYAQTRIFFNILEQSTFIGLLSVSLAIVIIAGKWTSPAKPRWRCPPWSPHGWVLHKG